MTSASDVRAYAAKHGISLTEAKLCLRRKRLDALVAKALGNDSLASLVTALKMVVEDHYPEDLDRRFPTGRCPKTGEPRAS